MDWTMHTHTQLSFLTVSEPEALYHHLYYLHLTGAVCVTAGKTSDVKQNYREGARELRAGGGER